ncbi:7272_t:CDS:1, partial [Acaulospora colombiana]
TVVDAPLKYGRESIIARAIKRHKSMISTRKKQFAAVLKGGPESDSLALEFALSARYPQLDGYESKSTTIYRSSRKLKAKNKDSQPFSSYMAVGTAPNGQFTFSCPCSSKYEFLEDKPTRSKHLPS